jgi:hypothetical protein
MEISLHRNELLRLGDPIQTISFSKAFCDHREIVAGVAVIKIGAQAPSALVISFEQSHSACRQPDGGE